jgi:hypothetical protein
LLGKGYKPEWLANINPLVVVLMVVPITHVIRNFKPSNAIGISLFIIPFTALAVGLGPLFQSKLGNSVDLGFLSLHTLVVVFIVGIGLQGLAECFLSPKWLEYASKQAPEGEVGLYLGYSHLTTFFAWLFAFVSAGYLLAAFCPDPAELSPEVRHQWRMATDRAYVFTMDETMMAELGQEGTLSPAVREAFTAHGIDAPADAAAKEGEPKDPWMRNPERNWTITLPDIEYTIEEVRLKNPDDEDGPKRAELLVRTDEAHQRTEASPLPSQYDRANYIWFVFAGVGFAAFLSLLGFRCVTDAIDRKRAAAEESDTPQTNG